MTQFMYHILLGTATIALFTGCNQDAQPKNEIQNTVGISSKNWGEWDGKSVFLYTLTNKNGVVVTISNYGGTITSWVVPDKNGKPGSIVLGFDSLTGYLEHPPYFGALVGRYGNRIANGKFKIGDSVYHLATNNGKNHLHGGLKGFDKVVWSASPTTDSVPMLVLNYTSKDGEEGYPGNLIVSVKYTLTNDNELSIEYNAVTDKTTPVNLTNHSYFNLSSDPERTVLDQTLWIDADNYTPVDSTLIPTGKIASVKGTPFDFTVPVKIGKGIDSVKGGYDHNFVLNRKDSSLQRVAQLTDSFSGRKLELFTTEPGLQFYTGNFLDGKFKTADGKSIGKHAALCLETQHFPDSPNEPDFPSTFLMPGKTYHTITKYRFSVLK